MKSIIPKNDHDLCPVSSLKTNTVNSFGLRGKQAINTVLIYHHLVSRHSALVGKQLLICRATSQASRVSEM